MGITKTEGFSQKENRLANIMKALGHPARIAIMEYLLKIEGCICGDIVKELPLSQSSISQHLKALKEVDLIKGNIKGTAICYCINEETIEEAFKFIKLFRKEVKKNKCC